MDQIVKMSIQKIGGTHEHIEYASLSWNSSTYPAPTMQMPGSKPQGLKKTVNNQFTGGLRGTGGVDVMSKD